MTEIKFVGPDDYNTPEGLCPTAEVYVTADVLEVAAHPGFGGNFVSEQARRQTLVINGEQVVAYRVKGLDMHIVVDGPEELEGVMLASDGNGGFFARKFEPENLNFLQTSEQQIGDDWCFNQDVWENGRQALLVHDLTFDVDEITETVFEVLPEIADL